MAVRPRSLLHQIVHTFTTNIFMFVVAFVSGVVVARALGPAGKGQISYAFLMLPFAVAMADGIRGAIMRQVGVNNQPEGTVYGTAVVIVLLQSLAGTIVCLALWRAMPQTPAYLYVAIVFPFMAYLQMVGAYYALRDDLARINSMNALTVGAVGSIATIVAVAFLHAGVDQVLAIWVSSIAAAAILAHRGLKQLSLGRISFGGTDLARSIATFGIKGALASVADFLSVRLALIIVAAVLSPAALGIYSLAIATAELTWQASRAVTWASTGRIANLAHDEARLLSSRLVRLVLSTQTAVGLILFLVGPWLIVRVYGPKFADAGLIMRVVLPGVVLYSVDGIFSTFLAVRANRPGLLLAFQVISVVLTAIAVGAGVRFNGLVGAAAGSSIVFGLTFAAKSIFFARYARVGFADLFVPRFNDLPSSIRLRFQKPVVDRP